MISGGLTDNGMWDPARTGPVLHRDIKKEYSYSNSCAFNHCSNQLSSQTPKDYPSILYRKHMRVKNATSKTEDTHIRMYSVHMPTGAKNINIFPIGFCRSSGLRALSFRSRSSSDPALLTIRSVGSSFGKRCASMRDRASS